MNDYTAEEIRDSELEEATGGARFETLGKTVNRYVYDTRGRCCGKFKDNVLNYWPCKKCGRPTHLGSGFHQCDKCDDWFWSISSAQYNGTEEQLKSESDAN